MMMFNRKQPKSFVGTLGSSLPLDDFESALEAPDSVMDNLEKMRPMISDIAQMAETPGWKNWIRPFLERRRDTSKLIQMIEEGKDVRIEAAQIKAYGSLLNLVGSMTRTKSSLDTMAAVRAAKENVNAVRDQEEG
jgi:hypothetical protein